jgi:hypothetical protein
MSRTGGARAFQPDRQRARHGEGAEAIDAYTKGLEIAPGLTQPLLTLLQQMSDTAGAKEALKGAPSTVTRRHVDARQAPLVDDLKTPA